MTVAPVYIPRGVWEDPKRPVDSGQTRSAPDVWRALTIHWPGRVNAAGEVIPYRHDEDWLAVVRAQHHSYLTSRGYSLGYCFLIPPTGEIIECRGWDIRNAANGSVASNKETVSVQLIGPAVGWPWPTPAQIVAVRWLHGEQMRRCGRMTTVNGHRDEKATSCPSDPVYALVKAGELTYRPAPIPPPPLPPMEDDMPSFSLVRLHDRPEVWRVSADGSWRTHVTAEALPLWQGINALQGGPGTIQVMGSPESVLAGGPSLALSKAWLDNIPRCDAPAPGAGPSAAQIADATALELAQRLAS